MSIHALIRLIRPLAMQVLGMLALGMLTVAPASAGPSHAGAPRAGPSWAQALAAQALEKGFLSRLPPNLSRGFGLSKPDHGTEVRQLLKRDRNRVRTFNVGVANHDDLVIYNVGTRDNRAVAYLLTPGGELRKAVAYPTPDEAKELTPAEARAAFAGEKRFWSARLRKRPAPAHPDAGVLKASPPGNTP